ncbi:MAG: MarC family protein [Candidatus Thermoplasmatota archaeon]|nr:MarC family protein [Candidatus Thermoplasmatota archaeon]MCL5888867.1 MarC family protein [Candidatus Thermoplasmatota archaeon]
MEDIGKALSPIALIEFSGYCLAAMFAIMNPIGAIPTLITLTDGYSRKEKLQTIRRSIYMASGMIFGFVLVGYYIFEGLGISINDFKVAGGILLFKVAFDMLQGKTSNTKLTKEESQEGKQQEDVGIVPIGTPLLAGPGSITTAILLNAKANTIPLKFGFGIALVILFVISYLILYFSSTIASKIGKTGTTVISRIMGLLLASIAIELITTGLIAIVSTL